MSSKQARQPRKGRAATRGDAASAARTGNAGNASPGKEFQAEEDKVRAIGRSLYALLSELRSTRFLKHKDDSPDAESEFLALLQRARPVTQEQRLFYYVIQSLDPNQSLAGFLNHRGKTAYALWAGPDAITHVLRLGNRARVIVNDDGSLGLSRDLQGGKSRGKIVVDDMPKPPNRRKDKSGKSNRSGGDQSRPSREEKSGGLRKSALLETWKKKQAEAEAEQKSETEPVPDPAPAAVLAAEPAAAPAPAPAPAPTSYASVAATAADVAAADAASAMGLGPDDCEPDESAVLLTRDAPDLSVPWGEE